MGHWAFSCVQIKQLAAHGISHAVLVSETNSELDFRAWDIDIFVLSEAKPRASIIALHLIGCDCWRSSLSFSESSPLGHESGFQSSLF